MLTYQDTIAELEKNFIYELCHIPVYPKDNEIPEGFYKRGEGEVSYFSFDEIIVMIDEGRKRGYIQPAIYLFVTSSLMSMVLKDLEANSPKMAALFDDDLGKTRLRETLIRLVKDYRSLLAETLYDSCNLYVGKIIRTPENYLPNVKIIKT